MWLFVDESWGPEAYLPRFGVLLGVLVRHDQLPALERLLFAVRKKYFGVEHAKNLKLDLKGKDLLANAVLRRRTPGAPLPRNLCVVKEILSFSASRPHFFLRVLASAVFSSTDAPPALLSPDPRRLSTPFRALIQAASQAAREHNAARQVTLVFDQRLGAQCDIAIAVRNYVGGLQLDNVHSYPYFAVSNVSPGVQVADVFAHLMAKHIQKNHAVADLFRQLRALEWRSADGRGRTGFLRYDERIEEGVARHTVRRSW